MLRERTKNLTLYLPGFSHRLVGRRARSDASGLGGKAEAQDGLAALVARFIPAGTFAPASGQRERVFTPWVTFIAFLGQVLSRGSACREAVRQDERRRGRTLYKRDLFEAKKSDPPSDLYLYDVRSWRLLDWVIRC